MIEPLHPRHDHAPLARMESQALAFESAVARGRLHHAWLLCGPQGVGKARFAYRMARRLLGAAPDASFGALGSSPDARAAHLIAARSHPDFLALHRETEDGKPRRVIPVDEARRLPEFFATTPALGACRVAIIDAADDLNVNAANAVLKTLEEPPAQGVLILVSHAPGRLLDTIRSRCRRLSFAPWPDAELEIWLKAQGTDAPAVIASLARGSPGRALRIAEGKAGEAETAAKALMASLPRGDEAMLVKLAEGFRGAPGAERFAALMERLAEQARLQALASADRDRGAAQGWAQAWRRLSQLPGEVEALNLDRADALWSAMADLRAAAR